MPTSRMSPSALGEAEGWGCVVEEASRVSFAWRRTGLEESSAMGEPSGAKAIVSTVGIPELSMH